MKVKLGIFLINEAETKKENGLKMNQKYVRFIINDF